MKLIEIKTLKLQYIPTYNYSQYQQLYNEGRFEEAYQLVKIITPGKYKVIKTKIDTDGVTYSRPNSYLINFNFEELWVEAKYCTKVEK